jgi:hypothetical protein
MMDHETLSAAVAQPYYGAIRPTAQNDLNI